MTGNLKYQAYQTAYIGVGHILLSYLFTIVFVIISWGLILPLSLPIHFICDWLIEKVISVVPSLLYLIAIIIVQQLVSHCTSGLNVLPVLQCNFFSFVVL